MFNKFLRMLFRESNIIENKPITLNFNGIETQVHFVTYGNKRFTNSRNRIAGEAEQMGIFSSIQVYTEKNLKLWFGKSPRTLKKILSSYRGGGYWLWKPLCVYEKLLHVNKGDVIVYADAGCTINPSKKNNLISLIQETIVHDSGIMRFINGHKEVLWTKGDVYQEIYPDAISDLTTRQLSSGRFIVVKSEKTMKHIKEWVDYALFQPHLFDDSPSDLPNYEEFIENRHDQSVFSLISKRRGCLVKEFKDIEPIIAATRIRR